MYIYNKLAIVLIVLFRIHHTVSIFNMLVMNVITVLLGVFTQSVLHT